MTRLQNRLRELILQGENIGVEFKSARAHPDAIAKELVAFANTQGGSLLVGVENGGVITGLDSLHDHEERMANIARNNLIPPLSITMDRVETSEGNVLMVTVPKGSERPYQTNKHQFLVRVGSTNRVASQGELMRLFQQAGSFHFDANAVNHGTMDSLNQMKLDRYFSQYNIEFSAEQNKEQLLNNAEIMTDEGCPTVAGLLMFGINPQKFLHFASISFVHYAGSEITDELMDKQVVEGTLDLQVDQMLTVLRHNIKAPSRIKGAKTTDLDFQYPEKVYRELLVNAVVHRNYAISGSRIRIQMFSDRIEFISPGRLPNTVTIAKLKIGVSYAVNPVILKFMENYRYIDKLGRGLPMVYQEARKQDREVFFEEVGEEFKVILER